MFTFDAFSVCQSLGQTSLFTFWPFQEQALNRKFYKIHNIRLYIITYILFCYNKILPVMSFSYIKEFFAYHMSDFLSFLSVYMFV